MKFQDIKRWAHVTDLEKKKLKARAIQGVIDRARALIKPIQIPQAPYTASFEELEATGRGFDFGDFDFEASIEASFERLFFESQREKEISIALVMDVSMSMKGEKLAQLALSAAALALSLPIDRLCFLGFDSHPRWVKRFGESMTVEALVEAVLNLPAGGFTNMEAALIAVSEELTRAVKPKTQVLLIGDGKFTEGRDPRYLISNFHRFHVLKIGRDIGGRELLKDLAQSGSGLFFEAGRNHELPKALYDSGRALAR